MTFIYFSLFHSQFYAFLVYILFVKFLHIFRHLHFSTFHNFSCKKSFSHFFYLILISRFKMKLMFWDCTTNAFNFFCFIFSTTSFADFLHQQNLKLFVKFAMLKIFCIFFINIFKTINSQFINFFGYFTFDIYFDIF